MRQRVSPDADRVDWGVHYSTQLGYSMIKNFSQMEEEFAAVP
jgi:hypothetical protein